MGCIKELFACNRSYCFEAILILALSVICHLNRYCLVAIVGAVDQLMTVVDLHGVPAHPNQGN